MKTSRILVLAALLGFPMAPAHADAPLRKGDQFDLRIGGVPAEEMSISNSYTVDGDGCLNLPLVGKVEVDGKTPSDAQAAIEHVYIERGIFTHPTIMITIAPSARLITVGGEVNNKGRISYTPDMTIMSAIGAAGDFSIYANQAKVRLIRGDKVTEINCKRIRSHPSEDVKVLPGDNIQVPQSMF